MNRTVSRRDSLAWLGPGAAGLVVALAVPAAAQNAGPSPLKVGDITIAGYIQADAIVADREEGDGEPPDTFVVPRDAWVQFTATPQFAVRVGQLVAPFGLERLTSYSRLEVIDRSVIGASMAPSRDVGLMVFSTHPWRGWITYGAAVIHGTGQNRVDDATSSGGGRACSSISDHGSEPALSSARVLHYGRRHLGCPYASSGRFSFSSSV